jgi:hypothetical protein
MSAVLSMPSGTDELSRVAAAESANRASLTPSDRLALSRERMRLALRAIPAARGDAADRHQGGAAAAWLVSLKSIPGADVVIEALGSWWARHPLRLAVLTAFDAAKVLVQPMARRHPLVLVLGALLLGGLLVSSRPWRWILRPALFAGFLPQLFYKLLARVPVESWIAALTALLAREAGGPSPDSPMPDGPSPESEPARNPNP